MATSPRSPEIGRTSVPTRTGRPMPLYLAGDDAEGDDWSSESLDESREELEEVTPCDRYADACGVDVAPPARPADRDADFARDLAASAASGTPALQARTVGEPLATIPAPSRDGDFTRIVRGEDDGGPGPGPEVMAADTLQGDRVMNLQGELLGKVRDIMIDVRRGRIAYAVLSSGGVVGFGDRLYAVPWSALTLDAGQQCFLLDITRERLMAAPGFDRDRWPSMADATFAQSVHTYYGQPSYWKTTG